MALESLGEAVIVQIQWITNHLSKLFTMLVLVEVAAFLLKLASHLLTASLSSLRSLNYLIDQASL